MKYRVLWKLLLLIAAFFFIARVNAQSPGLITHPQNGNGVTFLNPNGDKYTSKTSAGFTTNDETQSEIPYKIVPPAITEPVGDQVGGSSGSATDFVPNSSGNGFYAFYDGTNIMFRFRVGSYSPGSKGYSVLIDTDLRMGNSGFYADSNYVPQSASRSGNPGFELEVVYEGNKRVAVYNVDGTCNGTLIASYAENTNSQVSVALTRNSNDADYFVDFGVPASVLGIGTQYIRMVATTVTSASSALLGTASDVYGINDIPHKNLIPNWETIISGQCGFPVSALSLNGAGICVCTPRPSVNSPIYTGTNVAVTGMWNRLDPIKSSQATITLFQNGNIVGTTTATTGQTWSITVPSVTNGDIFYAKAQAAPEFMCLQSDPVTATCSATPPAIPTITCASTNGIKGTIPAGTAVKIYQVTGGNTNPYTTPITGGTYYPTITSFEYWGGAQGAGSPCNNGTANLATGTYYIITNNGGCYSVPQPICIYGASQNNWNGIANNSISLTTPIYSSQNYVQGTGTSSGMVLRLYVNNLYVTSITATGPSFTFSNIVLNPNDQIRIAEQSSAAGSCMTTSSPFNVTCFTAAPSIIVSRDTTILSTATAITGYSYYPGATVSLYKGTSPSGTLVATTTVASDKTWTVSGLTLTPGERYYATQSNAGCSSSPSLAALIVAPTPPCASITGSYDENSTAINGTLSQTFSGTLRLYQDTAIIKTIIVSNATTFSIPVNQDLVYYTDKLSPNSILRVTTQYPGYGERIDCPSQTVVACVSAPVPSVIPTAITIGQGETASFLINNTTSKFAYSIIDNSDSAYATSIFGNDGAQTIVTKAFTVPGTYGLKITADNLASIACRQSVPVSVTVNAITLPLRFIAFSVKSNAAQNKQLSWTIVNEESISHYEVERSFDCTHFEPVATIGAQSTADATKQYNYNDAIGAVQKTMCYRIKAVSINGVVIYSKVISVSENKDWQVQVAPNPTGSETTLYLNSEKEQLMTIEMLDITGRAALQKQIRISEGRNAIVLTDLKKYARGHYVLKLQTATTTTQVKLILE